MSLSAQQEAAVSSTLTALAGELAQAKSAADVTLFTVGSLVVYNDEGAGAAGQAAVMANLSAAGADIEQLRGELLDRARAGTYPFSRWAEFAITIHDDIAYQAGLQGDWAISSVLRKAVVATVGDVKEIAASVGGGFGVGVLVGLAVIAFVAWEVR